MHKKILMGIALVLSPILANASIPCGNSAPGVLNVGFLPDTLPYSGYDAVTDSAVGFDPLLIVAAAKLIGYDTVNFIGYGSATDALDALADGAIDVFADSAAALDTHAPYTTIGIVTDISHIALGVPYGWQLNLDCCSLALKLEAAISELVDNGTYANILQLVRLEGLATGFTLGVPYTASGILQEPFPYASSEVGTFPTGCAQTGPGFSVMLPATNCISAYLQANCTPATTFTGATGLTPP